MKILLIESDRTLSESLRLRLTESGYIVDLASDGVSGVHLVYETQYDLVIVDIGVRGLDGFEVLQRIRQHDDVAVMMLTQQGSLEERVRCLEQGADDYLVKPFLKRRCMVGGNGTISRNVLRVADLEIDLLRRRVARGRARIDLTPKEFALLTLLMRREGEVLSRLVLAEQVWDINFNSSTNVVEVAIRRLRAKIDEPFDVRLLHTVRGMGYTIEHRNAD